MTKIFLSYRRSDSASITKRIHAALETEFGVGNVFIDLDLGAGNFLKNVMAAINSADACIVVIGTSWLNATDDTTGEQRLFQLKDIVRREVEQALMRPLMVILLVNGAAVPNKDDLPESIEDLPSNQAFTVRDDVHFDEDMGRVARKVKGFFGETPPPHVFMQMPKTTPSPAFDVDQAMEAYLNAFKANQWERAQTLLRKIRASGEAPNSFKLERREAELAVKWTEYKTNLQRDREYKGLLRLATHADPQEVWESLQEFWQTYPKHDPDKLARFRPRIPIDKILPAPFQWIAIPGSTGKTWRGAPYHIAKYPVTNAQFAPFIEAGGYHERQWWTDAGWEAREKGWFLDETDWKFKESGKAWTEPHYWRDSTWNKTEQPVVGVSWQEAVAYCTWLSDLTGESITLPTDDQWQYAAQGDDERKFPWGNDWDCTHCNNSVKPCKSNGTTPVRKYEGKGDSFFGVTNMAGNVWEWCLTDGALTGDDINLSSPYRVLRGGSWGINSADNFRCDYRDWDAPFDRYNYRGFRFVLS